MLHQQRAVKSDVLLIRPASFRHFVFLKTNFLCSETAVCGSDHIKTKKTNKHQFVLRSPASEGQN